MKRSSQIAVGLVALLGLGLAGPAMAAQSPGMEHGPGHGAGHGMGYGAGHDPAAAGYTPMAGALSRLTHQDAGSSADMSLVHQLLMNHARIKRTVTHLPNGIRTVTESDDPQVARIIQAHVTSMSLRLTEGREFNIFSTTLPVLFANKDKIQSKVDATEKGSAVTRTSTDAQVVAALQGHAAEVTELAKEGMVAFHRGMNSSMAAGPRGQGTGPGTGPRNPPSSKPGHAY